MLQNGTIKIQETVICAIGSTAHAAGKVFIFFSKKKKKIKIKQIFSKKKKNYEIGIHSIFSSNISIFKNSYVIYK